MPEKGIVLSATDAELQTIRFPVAQGELALVPVDFLMRELNVVSEARKLKHEYNEMRRALEDVLAVDLETEACEPCHYEDGEGLYQFMTSSEYGVCDGNEKPIFNETLANALNAIAKAQVIMGVLKSSDPKDRIEEKRREQ